MDAQAQAQAMKSIITESVKNSVNDSFYLVSDDINILINDNITKYSPHFYTLFALIVTITLLNLFMFILLIIIFRYIYNVKKLLTLTNSV